MLGIRIFGRTVSFLFIMLVLSAVVSAGVGIKWSEESKVVGEGEDACMTYSVYNPFAEDTYVKIGVSEELQGILSLQEKDAVLIPAETSSQETIPVEFCFDVPKVYEKDCWLGDFFVCERPCTEEQVMYEGDVVVQSVPPPVGVEGSGGSTAIMAVSAPLRLRVACEQMARDYVFLYVLVAIVALVGFMIVMKFRKPREQRYEEQMKALKAKMARAKRKK